MKLRFFGAIVITLLFIYLLMPNINGGLLLQKVQHISFVELLLGFVALVIANVIRTLRFRTMDAFGGKFAQWWHINQTYNVLTTLLPGGGGEIATAYVMRGDSDKHESIFSAIRTLIFSRLMDLFFYSILLLATATFIINASKYSLLAIYAASMFAVIAWLALMPSIEKKLLFILEKYLINNFKILERFRGQLTVLIDVSEMQHEQGKIKLAFIQSLLVVLCAACAVYMTMLALGMEVTWYQGFGCLGLFALFQLVPVQGIAGIGTQAAWWSFSLTAIGYEANNVVTIGIMLHAIFLLFALIMFVPSGFRYLARSYGWQS